MEQPYLDLLRHVRDHGHPKEDRTGTGTLSLFGAQLRLPLRDAFPLLTTKRVHFKSVLVELLWFLRGDTNVRWLQARGVSIWDEWARPDGSLGPVYGQQWRAWPAPDGQTIDQLAQAIEALRHNPDSRRILVSAWNVAALDHMALHPCHVLFQFYSRPLAPHEQAALPHAPARALSCQVYQRSADLFLGVPFNLASYALLTRLIAQVTNHLPDGLVWTGGDVHLYRNHLAQADLQLARAPRPAPRLSLNPAIQDLDAFTEADIHLEGYDPHPPIKAPVAV